MANKKDTIKNDSDLDRVDPNLAAIVEQNSIGRFPGMLAPKILLWRADSIRV